MITVMLLPDPIYRHSVPFSHENVDYLEKEDMGCNRFHSFWPDLIYVQPLKQKLFHIHFNLSCFKPSNSLTQLKTKATLIHMLIAFVGGRLPSAGCLLDWTAAIRSGCTNYLLGNRN